MFVAQNDALQCVSTLLEHRPRLITLVESQGKTAVHLAASAGHADVVRLLAQQPHCDVQAEDNYDRLVRATYAVRYALLSDVAALCR